MYPLCKARISSGTLPSLASADTIITGDLIPKVLNC